MNIIEEENIMLENKNFIFVFSRDYLNEGLYIDVFDKKQQKLLVKDYEVKSLLHKRLIMEKINKKPGTILRHGKMKYIIKNHDKCVWSENGRRRIAGNYSSVDSVYDTRHVAPVPLLSRIVPFLKELWIKI